MRRLFLFLLFALLCSGIAGAQDNTSFIISERRTLDVGGVERVYSVYAPDTTAEGAPLILALHGRFSSGKALEATTHLSEAADANGWIVAYPQAYQFSWEDGGREYGLPRVGDDPQDDLAFIVQLIGALRDEFNTGSVTLIGFDTGGSMVERLLCESTERIDAAMLVSAVGWSYNATQCGDTTLTTDLLLVYGVHDKVYTPLGEELADYVQPDGSFIRRFGFYETVQFWAAQTACDETPEQVGMTSVFQNCADGTTVAAMLLSDVGHEWPRSGSYSATQNTLPATDGRALLAALIDGTLPVAETATATMNTAPRTYISYVPTTYTGEEPMPVVIGLHGRPDTGAGFAGISAMSLVAEDEGFIAVFPDGVQNQWNYLSGILSGASFNEPNDVVFLNTLIDDLALDLNIDLSRLYLTGFSNGGFMTYRMACNPTPNRFAAYGVAGALLYPEMETMCLAAPARAMIVEHGTEDVSILWDGITHMPAVGKVAVTRSVLQSVSFFAARNGCATNGAERTDLPPSDDATNVVRFDFADCSSGKPVRFFAVINGGHGWPGVDNLRHEIAGLVNMDINLSRELWAFFETQSLTDAEIAPE